MVQDERLKIASELNLISEVELTDLEKLAEESGQPVFELALTRGLLDGRHVEIIRAMLQPMDVAPGYEVFSLLGLGAAGIVFKANQVNLNRLVALKVMGRENSRDELARKRFEREARIIGGMRHPNIVMAVDSGVHRDRQFYSMEYVDGVSAEQCLAKYGRMDEGLAWQIALQVCDALNYANSLGVIHRDIKPGNLMLAHQPSTVKGKQSSLLVKVADFGLARFKEHLDPGLTVQRSPGGTPVFMSPEQIRGETLDSRTDVFALGITVWQLVLGQLPVTGDNPVEVMANRLKLKDTWLKNQPAGMSRAGFNLVQKMCYHDRNRRPNYDDLIFEILELIQSSGWSLNENLPWIQDPIRSDRIVTPGNTHSTQDLKSDQETLTYRSVAKKSNQRFLPFTIGSVIFVALLCGLIYRGFFIREDRRDPHMPPQFEGDRLSPDSLTEFEGAPLYLFDGLEVNPRQRFTGTWEVAEGPEGEKVLAGNGTRRFRCVDSKGQALEFFRFRTGFRMVDADQIDIAVYEEETQELQWSVGSGEVKLNAGGPIQLTKEASRLTEFGDEQLGYHQVFIDFQPGFWEVSLNGEVLGRVVKTPPVLPIVVELRVSGRGRAHFEQLLFRKFGLR